MTSSALLTLLCRGLATAMVLGTHVLVARQLGPDQLGHYAIAMAIGAVIVQFASLGMNVSNSYFLAQDQSLLSALVGNSVASSLVFGGLFTLALAACWQASFFFATLTPVLFWLAAAMVPSRLFMVLGGSLLLGLNRPKIYNLTQIASALLVLLGVGAVSLTGASLPGYMWATLAAWLVAAVFLMVMLVKNHAWPIRIDLDVFRQSVGYMGKAYVICLLSFLIRRGNLFLLEHFAEPSEVGYYSVAANGVDLLHLGPASLALVLFPKLVREDDPLRAQLTYKWLTRVSILLGLGVAVSSLLAMPAVNLVYGEEYLPVVPALWWMLPSVMFSGCTSILSQYMAAVGYPRSVIAIWLAGFMLMIATSCYWIPLHGGVGAGASLTIAYGFVFVMHFALMRFLNGTEHPRLVPAT